jgi:gliding motility-associated-like protein
MVYKRNFKRETHTSLLFYGVLLICLLICSTITAQTPGGISGGLQLWLKANAGTTTAGATVTAWQDQSVAGTVATVNGTPAFTNPGYNYNPYINFTMSSGAGGDFLHTPDINLQSFFWVAQLNNLARPSTHMATYDWVTLGMPCNGCPIHGGANGGVVAEYMEFGYGGGNFQAPGVWRQNGTATGIAYNTPHTGNYDIVTALGGSAVPINVFMGGQASNLPGFDGRPRDWLGPVGEIIAYNGPVTAVQANMIESYLAIKYGITLGGNGSTTLYYTSPTGTTIWTANTGYHNDVAGIGNDNIIEALDQPKSHSINTPADAVIMANGNFGTPVSLTDGQYLVWGNNAGAYSYTCQNFTHNGPSTALNAIWGRTWRTQITGAPVGSVILSMDMSLFQGPSGVGTANNADVRLLVDDNTAFGDGSVGEHSYTPNAGYSATSGQVYFTVPYADIQNGTGYFTLGLITSPSSVTITSTATTICAGTSVTFTATPTNGGTTPSYQWQVNGVNAGTNSSTFTTTTLNNNDLVTVILTSNATCVFPATATSNAITIIVSTTLVPSVTITSTATTICTGTPVTFTATPANGGTLPSYQWQVNGVNAGTNSPTFTSSTLNNNDIVTVILTSNSPCAAPLTVTSNTITITINNSPVVSVVIVASSSTICAGTPVTFTATPTNGGTLPSYQWQVNGVNTGTNAPTFTSSILNNNDVVTVILTSNAPCIAIATATSNLITIVVNPMVTPSVTIIASSTIICVGQSVTFTATPTNGGTTPNYQWQINGGNTGTNSNTFTSTTLNNNDVVTVVLTSNAPCTSVASSTSTGITINVLPLPVASFSYVSPTTGELNPTIQFINTSLNSTSWIWNFGTNSTSILQNPANMFISPGTYLVLLTASNGICTDTVSHIIDLTSLSTYYIPNTFTPDEDGINDVFNIKGTNISIDHFDMSIFNRWGELIFETTDLKLGWNGKTKTQALAEEGVYTYLLNFQLLSSPGNPSTKTGKITLIR